MKPFVSIGAQKPITNIILGGIRMKTLLFKNDHSVYAVVFSGNKKIPVFTINLIEWLLQASFCASESLDGPFPFIGPRREIITPWSTNASEIMGNCGITNVERVEEFFYSSGNFVYDPMLQSQYETINQGTLLLDRKPDPIIYVENISAYNNTEGLALNDGEISYLNDLAITNGRPWTDSELFGFSQANSEHCRHKIFNGDFLIDGITMKESLFSLIKKTTNTNPGSVVSAYVDNCAFLDGPYGWRFTVDENGYFKKNRGKQLITLKAETHNFPTTVAAFPGAATGTGGEIRDRMGGGRGSIPIAGTAVYMTPYPRFGGSNRGNMNERKWLYQTPEEILIRASNGASDYGNKFGQPLINGAVLTFEQLVGNVRYGYDKVILQAGGIGMAYSEDLDKGTPEKGDLIILLGGDNYRIGVGGGSVSSVNTGHYTGSIELNAVQRPNAEMQKRVFNVIRACIELKNNPIITVHDHGAGGHINCLSELVGDAGGVIYLNRLPIGDKTLSQKEIIGNESQERMAILIKKDNLSLVEEIANTERCPIYNIGEITGDGFLIFKDEITGEEPFNFALKDMFGKPPKTIMTDTSHHLNLKPLIYDISGDNFESLLKSVLMMEAVSSKDYLTSKVDRSVTGLVARQQCVGPLHLPLSDLGAVALDYIGIDGIATSLGSAPVAALIDAGIGSRLALAEALTNIVFAPLKDGISSVSCSANWMWPCRNVGEDARLYQAVKSLSEFAISLGINIPTGKDSMSMTQKYPNGEKVLAPGTVIITAVGHNSDITNIVSPVLNCDARDSIIIRIDFSCDELKLGGSSFAQAIGQLGDEAPDIKDSKYFIKAFNAVQQLNDSSMILAGHDISDGGLITTILEMCFANDKAGLNINFDMFQETDLAKICFAQNPGVILQVDCCALNILGSAGVGFEIIGFLDEPGSITIHKNCDYYQLNIADLRKTWSKTSYKLDALQSGIDSASKRLSNLGSQPLSYKFPAKFIGDISHYGRSFQDDNTGNIKAAIIREKGSNGDREMAWALSLAGFDVKDVTMSKLTDGSETLEDVRLIVFVGGFSNSDVLGSAKGWAGAFLFNKKAKQALDKFYARSDTMSLGVCNGCQLMMHLGLINKNHQIKPQMAHNNSGRFESGFVGVGVSTYPGIMLSSLSDSQLGIWVAHGEGKFLLPYAESDYRIALRYAYSDYPANPNGSHFNTAGLVSDDGRHLAMMPHPERCLRPYNWAYYPESRHNDEITPWIEMFINAYRWMVCEQNKL